MDDPAPLLMAAFIIPLGLTLKTYVPPGDCQDPIQCDHMTEGPTLTLRAEHSNLAELKQIKFNFVSDAGRPIQNSGETEARFSTAGSKGAAAPKSV